MIDRCRLQGLFSLKKNALHFSFQEENGTMWGAEFQKAQTNFITGQTRKDMFLYFSFRPKAMSEPQREERLGWNTLGLHHYQQYQQYCSYQPHALRPPFSTPHHIGKVIVSTTMVGFLREFAHNSAYGVKGRHTKNKRFFQWLNHLFL